MEDVSISRKLSPRIRAPLQVQVEMVEKVAKAVAMEEILSPLVAEVVEETSTITTEVVVQWAVTTTTKWAATSLP